MRSIDTIKRANETMPSLLSGSMAPSRSKYFSLRPLLTKDHNGTRIASNQASLRRYAGVVHSKRKAIRKSEVKSTFENL